MLTETEKEFLLEVAWNSVRSVLLEGVSLLPLPSEGPLAENGSAFVTVRRGSRLRGCIGIIGERQPLAEAVRNAARRAIVDPRFPRVTDAELVEIGLQVSVLTPTRLLGRPEDVQVGRHGLVVSRGPHTGLLLPQVAVEQAWDRERFLEQACLKAGLPSGAWREEGTKIEVFEAEVF